MLSEGGINILAGGGAGLIETLLTYPLDLAKTRQQLLTDSRQSRRVIEIFRRVLQTEGVRGLYAGLSAPLISEVPRRGVKVNNC